MTKPDLKKEEFPHLSKAPIVEAALDIRIVPSVKWDEARLQNELKRRLPDYPRLESLSLRHAKFPISPGKTDSPIIENFGCVGYKLHSTDNLHIAQFNKEAFVFSRLQPYENWQQFYGEALRLWLIYCELSRPQQITRVGLRFINRITVKQERVELADYYKYPPKPLEEMNWTLTGYLHHDVLRVPEMPYGVNLIKTVQNAPRDIGLILDIDVFTEEQIEYHEQYIEERLVEMRWVKNKVFFSSLTDNALSELR